MLLNVVEEAVRLLERAAEDHERDGDPLTAESHRYTAARLALQGRVQKR